MSARSSVVRRRWLRATGLVGGSLAVTTGVVALLESLGVSNASPLYLVGVVLSGVASGTRAAVAAALGSFLVYNYFFTEPRYTFAISDPGVLLSVILLLFAGVVVGQLAAAQRNRAELAVAREREARALFGVSRVLATRASTDVALGEIAGALLREAGMARLWVGIGPGPANERVAADTHPAMRRPPATRLRVLQRRPGDEPAAWSLVHGPSHVVQRTDRTAELYRVRIEASGELLGSIWAERSRGEPEPDATQTRLLAGAADQVGQALARDRAAEEARAAEVVRQADQLKSSLLQSVSHDFRTPLAVIRAAAGSMDADETSAEDRHASATAIEQEVEYLNGLVANLLDMSRIEAGALRADRDLYELDDVVRQAVDRRRVRLGARTVQLEVEPVIVRVDGVFLDAALVNLIENAIKYTPADATVRVSNAPLDAARVRLSVEDSGPGVPDEVLPRLFEKFYRAPGSRAGSRGGLGIGLAVVKGLIEATGGIVGARRSALGGLCVDLDLPLAGVPVHIDDMPAARVGS